MQGVKYGGMGCCQLKNTPLNMAWELYLEGPSQKVLLVIAHKASLDQCEPSENELWPFPLLLQLVQREEGREGEKRKGPDSSAVCHWASSNRGGV